MSVETEFFSAPRGEWQTDALVGLKFNVADDKDLSVRYSKTLAHGFNYFNDDKTFRQDDGSAIALIATKHNADKTSHTIKVEYENFDDGAITKNGYEPQTDNWLVTYKKTF